MPFLGERVLVRRRYTGPQTVDAAGDRIRGPSKDLVFWGALQDLTGKERQALREGERSSEVRKVICACGTLRAADQRNQLEPDEVVCGDAVYVVTRLIRDGNVIPHQSVLVTRRSEPR